MRRTALVTGASRGLGRALATALAADGWNIVVDGRDAAALDAARARIDAAGPGEVVALTGDIDDPIHVAGLVGAAVDQGRFELLVNNAGTLGPSPLPRRHPPAARRPRAHPAHQRRGAAAAPPGGTPPPPRAAARSSTSRPTPPSRATRAGAATAPRRRRSSSSAGCSPSRSPRCGCTGSTPATCGPACTRTPSPARTSRTARRPSPGCPDCCGSCRERPPSGRYRVDDLLAASEPATGPDHPPVLAGVAERVG